MSLSFKHFEPNQLCILLNCYVQHRCHRDAFDLAHCLRLRKLKKTGLLFMKETMKLWIASRSEALRTHCDIPISVGYNLTPQCLVRANLHLEYVCCLISRFSFLSNQDNYNLKSAQMKNTSKHSIQSSDNVGILTKVTTEILQPGPGLHQANECGQTTWYTTCAVIVAYVGSLLGMSSASGKQTVPARCCTQFRSSS